MAITLDNILGIHQRALGLRAERAELLSGNIANADTPGYKARDIDFQQALQQAQSAQETIGLNQTHQRHIAADGEPSFDQLQYRIPSQPSIDGNTVDSQIEKAEFTKNSLAFNASFTFLNGRIVGMRSAIRGE